MSKKEIRQNVADVLEELESDLHTYLENPYNDYYNLEYEEKIYVLKKFKKIVSTRLKYYMQNDKPAGIE